MKCAPRVSRGLSRPMIATILVWPATVTVAERRTHRFATKYQGNVSIVVTEPRDRNVKIVTLMCKELIATHVSKIFMVCRREDAFVCSNIFSLSLFIFVTRLYQECLILYLNLTKCCQIIINVDSILTTELMSSVNT